MKKYTTIASIALSFMFVNSAFAQKANQETTISTEQTNTIVLQVKGIKCGSGVSKINDALKLNKAIISSDIKGKMGAKTSFNVVYKPTITVEEIKNIIKKVPSCESPTVFPYKVK